MIYVQKSENLKMSNKCDIILSDIYLKEGLIPKYIYLYIKYKKKNSARVINTILW